MPTETPKRIHLLGECRFEEGYAASAITPGMLVAVNSAGKLIPHNVAGGAAERQFAVEDALQGKTIDDAYAADNLVFTVIGYPSNVVYAWLDDGEDVVEGDLLASAGNGRLQKVTGTNAPLAVALEALDLSDSDAENGRIRVRLM